MARELQAWFTTGATLYAVLRDASGNPWNGSAFDATPTAGEWGGYDIALTEDSTIGFYAGTFPASQAAGLYTYHVHRQAGGSPAATDPVVAVGGGDWSGTAWAPLATAAKLLSYVQSMLRSDVTVDADIGGTYDDATDSQQAIRDRGDAAWGSAGATGALTSGTAQSGSTSTTIKLASGASTTDDLYRYLIVLIDGGTGAGQARMITDYVGSTRVATLDRAWVTTPDNTSTYRVHHWSDNWAAETRTLTTPGATDADDTTTTAISRRRGDRWTIALTGLGSIATRTKLWFTLKAATPDADSAAWLQITEAGGLIVVYGGGSLTAANADITVDDAGDGDITITVAGVETAKLPARAAVFDVQVLRSGADGPDTIAEGAFTVTADVTRSTS